MKKYSKVLSLLLALAMILPGFAVQAAPDQVEVMRIAGNSRVGTSLELSGVAYTNSEEAVLVGYNGEVDALTGSIFAKSKNAPVLFARKSEVASVKAQLNDLGVKKVYILGGETAFSKELAAEFSAYSPERVSGDNRYETAINVSKKALGSKKASTIFLARGDGEFADALSIGPIATMQDAPLLLTHKTRLTAQTKQAIKDMGATRVEVIGGEAAISQTVLDELKALDVEYDRTFGDNRQLTAVEIAKKFNKTPSKIVIANGYNYADAVSAGYYAAKENAVILLSNTSSILVPVREYLAKHKLDTVILGGEKAIDKDTMDQIVESVEGTVVVLPSAAEKAKAAAEEAIAKLPETITLDNKAEVQAARALVNKAIELDKDVVIAGLDKLVAAEEKIAELEAPVTGLKVESVSAINAEEILVTFNTEVEKASAELNTNYELKINDTVKSISVGQIKVDKNTALIRLDSGSELRVGDKFVLQAKTNIVSKDGKALEKYASDQIEYRLQDAPKLVKTSLGTNQLVLEFDRPIDATGNAPSLIKLDGIALSVPNWTADDATEPGNYKYTVDLAVGAEQTLAAKSGKHNLVIFDVYETSATNPVKASVINASYEVKADDVVPVVKNITPLNSNKFFIELNRAANNLKPKITVEKGNHEFTVNSIDETGTTVDPSSGGSSEVSAVSGTYLGKPGYYVVVSEEAKTAPFDENPLYKGTEISVNLKVTFENFQVVGSSLLGQKYVGNVILKKDTVKPEIKSAVFDDTSGTENIKVVFKDDLKAAPALADIVVRDKNNVVVTPTAVPTLAADTVTIPMVGFTDEPFTVEFKAGKLTYPAVTNSVVGYVVESPKNDKLTVTAKSAGSAVVKFVELAATAVTNTGNTLKINYGQKMGASATNLANYKLDGQPLPAGTTIDFVGDTENVHITLPEESITDSTGYKLTISTLVETLAGERIVASVQTKLPVERVLTLKDNVKPVLLSAKFVNIASATKLTKEIELTFSEAIDTANLVGGTDTFSDDLIVRVAGNKIVIDDTTVGIIDVTDAANGKIIIKLTVDVNTTQAATIETVGENATNNPVANFVDGEANELKAGTIVNVTK